MQTWLRRSRYSYYPSTLARYTFFLDGSRRSVCTTILSSDSSCLSSGLSFNNQATNVDAAPTEILISGCHIWQTHSPKIQLRIDVCNMYGHFGCRLSPSQILFLQVWNVLYNTNNGDLYTQPSSYRSLVLGTNHLGILNTLSSKWAYGLKYHRLGSQSRFGGKPVKFQLLYLQNWTKIQNGLASPSVTHRIGYHSCWKYIFRLSHTRSSELSDDVKLRCTIKTNNYKTTCIPSAWNDTPPEILCQTRWVACGKIPENGQHVQLTRRIVPRQLITQTVNMSSILSGSIHQ